MRVRRASKKDLPNAPPYYIRELDPWTLGSNVTPASKEFLGRLKGAYTPGDELINLFMLPIPADVGPVQCTILRDKKGMNKFWPKYALHLSDPQRTMLLQSSKIKTSKTPHYRIEIKTGND